MWQLNKFLLRTGKEKVRVKGTVVPVNTAGAEVCLHSFLTLELNGAE